MILVLVDLDFIDYCFVAHFISREELRKFLQISNHRYVFQEKVNHNQTTCG